MISVGQLDLTSEGLLLLTNDGALARRLELPETGWLRRYRVRFFGNVGQDELDKLEAQDHRRRRALRPHRTVLERSRGELVGDGFLARRQEPRSAQGVRASGG
ncbi:MAG: hypothetical protein U1F24_03935 [Alphaproteobacteria bacterium]